MGARIRHIYISPGHNYFGHHNRPPGENPIIACERVRCVAGKGLEGDRFFDYKENYKGQVTFFAWETYEALIQQFRGQLPDPPPAPSVFRRNIITEGMIPESLIGKEFEIQGVRFRGMAESKPCHWMNQAFCEGAEKALEGRGGLRAIIVSDGELTVDSQ
jgi:MOSC domain-containing protein YiiM